MVRARVVNGNGACALTQPFDNEERRARGGERRALDKRVYTFVYTSEDSYRLSGRKTRVRCAKLVLSFFEWDTVNERFRQSRGGTLGSVQVARHKRLFAAPKVDEDTVVACGATELTVKNSV